MKCSKCKKNYKDTEVKCPKCGEVNQKLLEDKTIAIEEVSEDLSLTGLISNQIEEFNEEKKEKKVTKKKTTKKKEEVFGSKKDISLRKQILLRVGIMITIIVMVVACLVILLRNNNDKYDYVYELNVILSDYDNVEDKTEFYDILAYVGNDDEKINNVHNNTYIAINGWVSKYKEYEYSGIEDVEKETTNIKNKIDYINNIEYEGTKLLKYEDYEKFINEIDKYFLDSKPFYESLSYYNKNYYNEAFAMFDNIESENLFKDKANKYKDKIIEDVLTLLNNDVNNILLEIKEDSSVADKLDIYLDIENVIATYNDKYSNLDLDSNETYNNLMEEYKDKINEYVPLVVGEE